MVRIWRVFWQEYWGHLTRRSYLLFTFGFPLFILAAPVVGGAVLALAIRSALPPTDPRPIGLVDRAGLFADAEDYPDEPVDVILFANPEAATAALDSGEIQAYYDFEPEYWETGEVNLTYETAPGLEVDQMVINWVRNRVRSRVPPDIRGRLDQGPDITHQNLSGSRAYSLSNVIEPVVVFILVYLVRLGGSFTAEYMFGSIAREAQDRTLEILMTSVSPLQFVLGKLLGLMAVGLTQLGTWSAVGLGLAVVAGSFFEFDLIGTLLNWEHLGLLLSILLSAYIMDQMLAATLGMFRVSGGAGSQFFNTTNWVVGIGLIYAVYFVPRNPHSPLAIAASFFPITAPIVLLIRVVVTEVPRWQIIVTYLCLWGTILASVVWLRWLLKTNLVTYAPPFSLRRWLRKRLRRREQVFE